MIDPGLRDGFDGEMSDNEDNTDSARRPAPATITDADLSRFGQKHIGSWLQVSGYVVQQVTELLGLTEIEADHGNSKMLVHVRTSLVPVAPKDLSPEECRNLKSRALERGRKPYAVKLRVDYKGNIAGTMKWQQLV